MEMPFVLILSILLNLVLSSFVGFSVFVIVSYLWEFAKLKWRLMLSILVIIIFQELWWSNWFNLAI